MPNVVPFPRKQMLRVELERLFQKYPSIRERRQAGLILQRMAHMRRAILPPGTAERLGFQPLLEARFLVNHGHGEYGAADADISAFLGGLQFTRFWYPQFPSHP